MPLGLAASRTGLRYRSIVAALIASSSSTVAVSNPRSSPASSSVGIHWGSISFMYFAHGRSISSHTCSSRRRDRSEYRFGRSRGASRPSPARPASLSLRLAVLLPIFSVSHMRSRMTPLSFFDAFAYSSLNLRVICRLVAMLILSSMEPAKQEGWVSRSPPVRRPLHFSRSKNVMHVAQTSSDQRT